MALSEKQVFEKVRACLVDALEIEPRDVVPTATLIGDLGAESVDLLDIVFRLERQFRIRIPRGGLEKRAKKKVRKWVDKGVLTSEALAVLRDSMPEIDPTRIRPGLRPRDIPRLFTVQTFVQLVRQQLDEAAAAPGHSLISQVARRATSRRRARH